MDAMFTMLPPSFMRGMAALVEENVVRRLYLSCSCCDGAPALAPAAFAITVYADGKTYLAKGSVALEQFEVAVLDFEVQSTRVTE